MMMALYHSAKSPPFGGSASASLRPGGGAAAAPAPATRLSACARSLPGALRLQQSLHVYASMQEADAQQKIETCQLRHMNAPAIKHAQRS